MASSPEPGYEIWHEVEIEERCIETFDTRTLADGKQLGNRCMNCHTHGGNEGQYSYFYIRGEKGGTFVNRDNKFEKMTLSSASTNGSTVYGNWHSSGRFGVFSTNEIIPAFHADPAHDDMCLKSYNIPDLTMHPAPFGHDQVKQLLESAQAIPFTFPEGIVLPAGGSVVVAKDVTDIPSGHHAEQWESGKLTDEGEAIALTTPSGVTIDQVAYLPTAPWPAITEGGERAIVLKDLLKANHIGTNWQLKRTVDIADILPPHSPLRAYDLQGRPADLRSTHGLVIISGRKIQRK